MSIALKKVLKMSEFDKGRRMDDSIDDSVTTNTSSDVGYAVTAPHHSNAPSQSNDRMVVDFNISRAKTKNRGRCLLYLGLIIVILNFIGILA